MRREVWRLLGYGSLIGCLCVLNGLAYVSAQGEPPRPSRRAGHGGTAPTAPAAGASTKIPQPLAPGAIITLDQSGLSLNVQEQDLPAIVERIAALGQIEIRHPEGIPNRPVSIRFTSLPIVDGLKRLFRVADVPGYVLVTAKQGNSIQLQRIVFLTEEGASPGMGARGMQRPNAVSAAVPARPAVQQSTPGVSPPAGTAPLPPPQAQPEEARSTEGGGGTSVFDDIKSNAAARRLLSQMMHPNEQVRERAFEGLVRLFREDEKQRALMELLEPLMEDLAVEDKGTQDEAREEIRKLLSR